MTVPSKPIGAAENTFATVMVVLVKHSPHEYTRGEI
jgi:hypothetical protein